MTDAKKDKAITTLTITGDQHLLDDIEQILREAYADRCQSLEECDNGTGHTTTLVEALGDLADQLAHEIKYGWCGRCATKSDDVTERYSLGVYAGRMCTSCARNSYVDGCGERDVSPEERAELGIDDCAEREAEDYERLEETMYGDEY
jgi:hypothetical protein